MAKGSKKAGERFQAPERTVGGKFASHRSAGSRAPIRQTKAQSDAQIVRDFGLAPKPVRKPKPKVPAKAAGAVASSPSTTSLEAAVAKLNAALRR